MLKIDHEPEFTLFLRSAEWFLAGAGAQTPPRTIRPSG